MLLGQWSVVAKRRASFLAACTLGSGLVWFAGCNPSAPSASTDDGSDKVEIARSKRLETPNVDDDSPPVREPSSSKNSAKSVYGDDEPEVPSLTGSGGSGEQTDELVDESDEDESVLLKRLETLAIEAASQQQGKVTRSSLPKLRTKHRERIATADKVLKLSKPSTEAVQTAYTVKLDAYDNLIALETENAAEDFRALCNELVNHSDPQLARVGRIMTLQFLSQDWAQTNRDNGRILVDAVIEVLSHTEIEPQLIGVCAKIASDLNEAKLPDDAAEVYESIAKSAEKSDDARMKVEASAAALQAKLLREGVHTAVDEYAAASEPDIADVAARIEKVFEDANADAGSFSVFSNLAAKWEAEGLLRPSEQIYMGIQKLFASLDDKVLAPRVKQTVDTARKRLGLIGQSMTIEGKTLDGQPFDWSAYQGKVVLVDFWATWCEPCREEMGNISQVYEKYRDAGFEVVGVNLDEDQDVLSQFQEQNKLAWNNVVSDKNGELGFNNPLAVRCGVRYIPFVMLIDKSGKVAAIHTRGARLEPAVKELLGEGASETGDSSSTQIGVAPEENEPGVLPSDDDSNPKDSGPAVASDENPKSNPLRTGSKPPPAPLRKKSTK
jgi:thiol-disulfide isomerase/thioredoxin